MTIKIDTLTANDPQQTPPVGFCPVCGGAIYCEGRETCTLCDTEVEPDD